jgi:hypothetical protein
MHTILLWAFNSVALRISSHIEMVPAHSCLKLVIIPSRCVVFRVYLLDLFHVKKYLSPVSSKVPNNFWLVLSLRFHLLTLSLLFNTHRNS